MVKLFKTKIWWKNKILLYGYTDIVYIKTDDIYKDIAEDVETRFDTSNYDLDRSLSKGKNKNVTGLMKDELGGKVMRKLVGLRAKTYSYLIVDNSKDKKAKDAKKYVIKKKLKFDIDNFFFYKRKHKKFMRNKKTG